MDKRMYIIAALIAVAVIAGIADFIQPRLGGGHVIAGLQVTEYSNASALAKVVSTMASYGIKPSTIFVSKEVVGQNCTLIRNLDSEGYEIAAFAYNVSPAGVLVPISSLTDVQQESIINGTKSALEACLGHPVYGFRSQGFSKNNYTNELVSQLGFRWDASFVTGVDPQASPVPYYSNTYGFYVVSIPGIIEAGRAYVLCDRACASTGKTAQQWREMVESAYLEDKVSGAPFITEFHPNFLVSNSTWWGNFTQLLGWMSQQNATYMTTWQLIENCTKPQLTCGG